MLDLKNLFKKYRVSYVERGPNCSAGHVNIKCVWCGNADKSYHLGINLLTGQHFCFRNPSHVGNYIDNVLRKLHIPQSEFVNKKFLPNLTESHISDGRDYSLYRHFQPAVDSEEAQAYLSNRHFNRPMDIATEFDLKVDTVGHWAGRLIIPLTIGWIGRAMRPHLQLRYDAFTNTDGFFYHSNNKNTSVAIFEGALDAMRVFSVYSQFDVIGKCGNRLSAGLLLKLKEKNYRSIYNGPDGTVPYIQRYQETQTLKSYNPMAEVRVITMPKDQKDFCEMTESEARSWLKQQCVQNV